MMSSSSGRILAKRVVSTLRLTGVSQNHQPKRYVQQESNAIPEFIEKCYYYSPTEGYIRTSPFEPIVLPELTLDKYVWEDFTKWQNKVAMACIVSGRQYTYAQLRDHSAALALRLQHKFKLKPRDVAAVCLPNLPEYPIAFLGCVEAGLTVTTVNPMYTAEEIGRQLVNSNSQFMIGTVKHYQILKEACEVAKRNIPICCIRTGRNDSMPPGAIDFFEIVDPTTCDFSTLRPADININDMVCLPYSSGTTGLPKGVMLTHLNITSNCEMTYTKSPFPPIMLDAAEGRDQEVVPAVLPFFHIYGQTGVMLSKLKLGCKVVTLPRFNPDDLIKSIYDYKATVLYLVPPIILFLTNSPKAEKHHLDHLRLVISGAAPIGALDIEKFVAKFPHVSFMQGYGMTETSPAVMMCYSHPDKRSSVGLVTPNTEAKVASLDSENREGLPPHAIGEICVRGPQVMPGYLNNEEATKDIFLDGNWLRTGDVGYYDEEGYFFITDRMKELIKVKGFQVPPAELEELLRDHPKVLDAGVIGVPHEQFGEVPKAFVVLRPNVQVTEQEIKDYIAERVVYYKKLEGGVKFLNEIPKSVAGKILRRELKNC